MQHLPHIDVARRALRAAICPTCSQRPPHSETLPSTTPRACEPHCALFEYIDKLMDIADSDVKGPVGDFERIIRNEICNNCCSRPRAGDYCEVRLTSTCPLTCYAGQAVAILETLTRPHDHGSKVPGHQVVH